MEDADLNTSIHAHSEVDDVLDTDIDTNTMTFQRFDPVQSQLSIPKSVHQENR